MSVAQSTSEGLVRSVFLISIFGCIINIAFSTVLSYWLWYDYEWTQTLLMNPIVYGIIALGWLLIIPGLMNLGLERNQGSLETIVTPNTRIYNYGCLTGVPIILGLFIGLIYQVSAVGNSLDYFLALPILTTVGMVMLGVALIIYNKNLSISRSAIYIGILFVGTGSGTFVVVQSGIFLLNAGLVIWLLIVTGPIFLIPLMLMFLFERWKFVLQPRTSKNSVH